MPRRLRERSAQALSLLLAALRGRVLRHVAGEARGVAGLRQIEARALRKVAQGLRVRTPANA